MKRILLGVAAATLSWQAQACTIVTDGTLEVYIHELAHCNGWDHKPFESGHEPTVQWIHPFKGAVLLVFLTGSDIEEQNTTLNYAQPDAQIIMAPNRTVSQLCSMLWKQNNIKATQTQADSIIGCAVR